LKEDAALQRTGTFVPKRPAGCALAIGKEGQYLTALDSMFLSGVQFRKLDDSRGIRPIVEL
ncbi:MAG: hypothetical protein KDN22_20800, partial [Verrucomicrobiae bacterium]|nr:hypothetical protein [Verrucomicrobiae bacterium]